MKGSTAINVLLVEDDPVDIYVIQRIVADFGPELRLWVIPDGVEALLFLNKALSLAPAPTRPHPARPQIVTDGWRPATAADSLAPRLSGDPHCDLQ